jgi:hypothetical protein
MDELNAAPSSTEPTAEELASIAMGTNAQEVGAAASGEFNSSVASDGATGAVSETEDANVGAGPLPDQAASHGDAPAVGGGIDAPSHLLLLDAMLAEIERKIATGVHLFAQEVTAARDHLAKLL